MGKMQVWHICNARWLCWLLRQRNYILIRAHAATAGASPTGPDKGSWVLRVRNAGACQ